MAARPSCQVTTPISASEATLIPSTMCPAVGEERSFGSRGAVNGDEEECGKKTPSVATSAPLPPCRTYPMNVAVVKTGPGVTCPTATASNNCC